MESKRVVSHNYTVFYVGAVNVHKRCWVNYGHHSPIYAKTVDVSV